MQSSPRRHSRGNMTRSAKSLPGMACSCVRSIEKKRNEANAVQRILLSPVHRLVLRKPVLDESVDGYDAVRFECQSKSSHFSLLLIAVQIVLAD
jgi:hypothetical protein